MSAYGSMPTNDLDLDLALRDLGSVLATPAGPRAPATRDARPDLATRVRARIEAEQPRRANVPWWRELMQPAAIGRAPRIRRSFLLAAAALLLAAAAVTAAIGYGLPGIRILFGPGPSITPPTETAPPSSPPGATLGLGGRVTLDDARERVDFPVLLPPDPSIGPPDAVYLAGPRLTLVWAPRPGLPGTADPRIGLLLVELHANIDETMIQKNIDSGTSVERVTVGDAPGYWIAGERHMITYLDPNGVPVMDSERVVGNTLVWTAEGITYRLEGEFNRAVAVALAESLR
jgi:hypothetical protein